MISKAESIANVITVAVPVFSLAILAIVTWSFRTASRKPLRAFFVPVLSSIVLVSLLNILPLIVESTLNEILPIPEHHLKNAEKLKSSSLLQGLKTADLHSDALLWGGRDFASIIKHPLNSHERIGHVDLPTLRKGNVLLQVFAIVNSVPKTINFGDEVYSKPSLWKDSITLKAILERWSIQSWFSPKHRVLYSAKRLREVAARPKERLSIIRTNDDLPAIDDDDRNGIVHALLAVEGLSCLENDVSNVDTFYDAGVRILGPTHFFDTEVGGSLSGECRCGLSEFGRATMKRMKELGMIVDFTHSHPSLVKDVVSLPEKDRPAIMLSHTGAKSVCNTSRNLEDDILRLVVSSGGIIGIALFPPAICGDDLIKSFVESVKHIINLAGGVGSIALGSDWDGSVTVAVTPDRVDVLAAALIEVGGLERRDVERVMYENAVEFFKRSLPAMPAR